jgi:hypothetical protein
MSIHERAGPGSRTHAGMLTWRTGLILLGFLVIVGTLLWAEHSAHILGALIWLPLVFCVGMHMFMHGGHGGHGHAGHDHSDQDRGKP